MIWLLYLPLVLLCSVFCYLTNWLVVLFADKNGELHGFLHLWQTWDNSVNPSDVTELRELPSFLLYNWKAHYYEYEAGTSYMGSTNRKRWYTMCFNDDWTLKERLRRYICRVYWLTRNCAYGFCFYLFGNVVDSAGVVEKTFIQEGTGRELIIGWDVSKDILVRPWWVKCDWMITDNVEFNVYLGWKWHMDETAIKQVMIANRVAVKIR